MTVASGGGTAKKRTPLQKAARQTVRKQRQLKAMGFQGEGPRYQRKIKKANTIAKTLQATPGRITKKETRVINLLTSATRGVTTNKEAADSHKVLRRKAKRG